MIPFVDLARSQAEIGEELEAAIAGVVARGDYIGGPDVSAFEDEFATFTGSSYAIGVSSGTAAIAVAIVVAGIGPGDEVIVPAHTYIATALGVVQAGANPVFCDVDEASGLIDLESAAEVAGGRTAAVLPVHLYGQVCDMDAIGDFASARGIVVIEDAAQAHGGRWDGRHAGSFGLAGAFSFYPSKNLGALGDAGAIVTNDPALADRARRLRNLGQLRKGEHDVVGYNERLDTLQAAVLRVKLRHLERWNESRRSAARRYREHLPASVRVPPARSRSTDVHHLMAVRVDDRDGVVAELAERGVSAAVHYDRAVHQHAPFLDAELRTDLGCSERWAAEEISLPIFALIGDDEVDVVCERLEQALEVIARTSALYPRPPRDG